MFREAIHCTKTSFIPLPMECISTNQNSLIHQDQSGNRSTFYLIFTGAG